MADAQLKIRIGADIGAAVSGVGKLNNVLRETASAADLAGLKFTGITGRAPLGDINSFRNAVNRLKTDVSSGFVPAIQRISPAINNASQSLRNIRPGANQAAFALTNVGRVAQDLPFGFIGIQNNLNPLLESFQRLRAETGSGKAALAALGSSLIGPAGIGIALSVVSAAFVIFQNGISGFNKKTKEAKDKADEFIKTLKDVRSVTDEAAAAQQGNIAQVKALAGVIQNTNNSYEERKRALNDLKQINKSYFGDLTLEESKMALLTSRVNEYTQALVQQAVVKGFTDEISRVSVELAKQDKALKASRDNLERLENQLANTKESETSLTGEDRVSGKYIKAKNAVEDAEKAFIGQRDIVEKLQTNYAELSGAIDEAVKQSLKFKSLDTASGQKEIDQLSKRLAALEKLKEATQDINQLVGIEEQIFDLKVRITLRDAAKEGLSKSETDLLIDSYRRQLESVFLQQALSLEASPRVQVQNINIVPIPAKEVESAIAKAIGVDKKISALTISDLNIIIKGSAVRAEIQEKEAIIKSLQDQIKTIINQGLVDSFAGIGESIGQILAGGGVGNIAKSFLLVVANAVQSIGKAAISAGVAMLGLKKALTAILANPAGLILAGSALVALGAGLKASIENSVPKFAQGGIATGPTLGIFGEKGTEAVIPLDRLPQLIRQAGSNGTVTVNGRLTMDSRQLVANLSRAQTNFDRIN